MKIGIELSTEEYAGIKKYLKANGIPANRTTVAAFIRDELNGLLYMNTSVSDYVQAELNKTT